jgi:hypothetical protein
MDGTVVDVRAEEQSGELEGIRRDPRRAPLASGAGDAGRPRVMQALRRNDSEGEAIRELLAWMFQASRKGWVLVKDHRIVATNPTFDELDLQSRIGQSWAPAPAGEVDPSEPSCHGPFESLRALVIRHSGVVPSPRRGRMSRRW